MGDLGDAEHRRQAAGLMSDKDWDATVGVLKQYGGVTVPLEASQLYTNEFVPTGSEFVRLKPDRVARAQEGSWP